MKKSARGLQKNDTIFLAQPLSVLLSSMRKCKSLEIVEPGGPVGGLPGLRA